jgi:hypothetical protein
MARLCMNRELLAKVCSNETKYTIYFGMEGIDPQPGNVIPDLGTQGSFSTPHVKTSHNK